MKPQKFISVPTEIEAIQFNGIDDYADIVKWMMDCGDTHALADEVRYSTPIMMIPTLEGMMTASPGDWIIRGTRNEFYPCKPDVFAVKYSKLSEESADYVRRMGE